MVQFKGIWLSWILLVSIFSTSFIDPATETLEEIEELRTQVHGLQTQLMQTEICYEEELGELRDQVSKQSELVADPLNLVKMLYSHRRSHLKEIKKTGKFVGTNLKLRDQGINPRISPQLYAAFLDCTGPEVKVNSAVRLDNPKSQHSTGEALDLRYDATGIAFAKWMVSKEGTEWRKRFGISFYVEASSSKNPIFKDLGGPEFKPFHFVNSGATGPHLHLYIERRRNNAETKKDRDDNPNL